MVQIEEGCSPTPCLRSLLFNAHSLIFEVVLSLEYVDILKSTASSSIIRDPKGVAMVVVVV